MGFIVGLIIGLAAGWAGAKYVATHPEAPAALWAKMTNLFRRKT